MKKIILMLIVLTFTFSLFSVIIYVPDDEPTIQDAVDAANDGDVIVLRDDSTYQESVSLDSFNGGELTIRSEDPDDWDCIESTIVDPISINDNVFERTSINHTTEIDLTIQGLTITGGNHGFYLCETYNSYEVVLQYCIIEDNNFNGVKSEDPSLVTIENCKIRGNGQFGVITTWSYTGLDRDISLIINNSEISNNIQGGVYDDRLMEIDKCTIVKNGSSLGDYAITSDEGLIENSIIWDNQAQIFIFAGGEVTVAYSDVEGGHLGTGNINSDPIFTDDTNGDYTLTWDSDDKSPCIDTGDTSSPDDPDGSRADMGAYYKDHEEKNYYFEGQYSANDGWTWLCFDVLDPTDASTYNQVQYLLEDIESDLEHGEHEGTHFSWELLGGWTNGGELVISPKGYKIEMEGQNSIDVSGFRCNPYTTFDLYALAPYDNWIGYFLNRTQHVYNAFDGYLDDINSIVHQDWSVRKSNGEWPDVNYTLSLGDMVIVDCSSDIDEFCWDSLTESQKFIVPDAQSFSFTQEADYIPIYIELDENNLPDEIGVFVDDECKGARVVQSDFEDICAYISETQYGSVEFEFVYGNRGVPTRLNQYTVFDPDTGYRETTSIDLSDNQEYYYVSFRSPSGNDSNDLPVKLSASNYPNPFNPTTTISYDLPSDDIIELSIYNIRGQQVKNLIMGEQIAGSYEVVWNGKDNNEKSVSSGLYFYKLSTKDKTVMKKILMLK